MPTMHRSSAVFPAGTPVPGSGSESVPVVAGQPVTESADAQLPGQPYNFIFVFWDINGSLYTQANPPAFEAPIDDFSATAWYLPEGPPNGHTKGVTVWAFSLNKNQTVTNSPIAAVVPSGAWPGLPSDFVSTTTSPNPVVITAQTLIAHLGKFDAWLVWGNGAVAGHNLTVPSGGASLAIAFYGIPVPDPCQPIRDEIANISSSDFQSPADFQKAFRALEARLLECERQYGELP
jgi:hypothetical protein